jgi:hypothetical protein
MLVEDDVRRPTTGRVLSRLLMTRAGVAADSRGETVTLPWLTQNAEATPLSPQVCERLR